MEKLKYAQELIKGSNSVMGGFNTFISGGQEPRGYEYGDKSEWFARFQGYQYAEQMAKDNGIAFIKPFKCGVSDNCHPFKYGGFFVCNSCGNKGVDKEWWKIKVEKDGNAYCCHGLDFINLQESDNYAFGDTFEEAIKNYEALKLIK
tara:strand:- start:985 stop:1425 length:441 start_codon:yes stop_codon:yes gene_type:complete